MEVRGVGEREGILIGVGARAQLGKRLKEKDGGTHEEAPDAGETHRGILRAVHLDKDWLEVVTGDTPVRVHGVQDTLDDVIGPMVNRRVVVTARKHKKQRRLVDIELDE
jgi:hypothetical protein